MVSMSRIDRLIFMGGSGSAVSGAGRVTLLI
jgi:hypothetical protein